MAQPKKFYYSDPKKCVEEMLHGLKSAHPALCVDTDSRIVMINRDRRHRVGLISGGGSGHEPFSFGYVGEGMLTAAVAGNIFASPSSLNIATAINNVARLNTGGVLLFVLNYTGDVLNFGLAIEEARDTGIKVECVVIKDDCATSGADMVSIAGKRGMCGCVFIFKIAGTLSSAGRSLSEIATEARAVGCRLSTMGLCLVPCSMPGMGPLFTLDNDEMLIGVGVHGEAGIANVKVCSPPEAVRLLLSRITKDIMLKPGDPVCVLVNNLGTMTTIELYIIVAEVKRQLAAEYKVVRMYVGTLMSSLDMRGIQVSILNVIKRDEWVEYLDVDTEAFGWPGTKLSRINEKYPDVPLNLTIDKDAAPPEIEGMEIGESEGIAFRDCIKAVCQALMKNEQKLNSLDTVGGDGDCGTTFKNFSEAVLKVYQKLPVKKVSSCFVTLSNIAKTEMGGTSGALYSIMLLGASKSKTDWQTAWKNSIALLRKYSSAQLGHRTMLDALLPAYEEFVLQLEELGTDSWKEALKSALDKAEAGCENTVNMIAKAGRASYVDPAVLTEVDPGASAVVIWLSAICDTLLKNTAG